jgi:hypothetical protein
MSVFVRDVVVMTSPVSLPPARWPIAQRLVAVIVRASCILRVIGVVIDFFLSSLSVSTFLLRQSFAPPQVFQAAVVLRRQAALSIPTVEFSAGRSVSTGDAVVYSRCDAPRLGGPVSTKDQVWRDRMAPLTH